VKTFETKSIYSQSWRTEFLDRLNVGDYLWKDELQKSVNRLDAKMGEAY
jgi:hypothetical protein